MCSIACARPFRHGRAPSNCQREFSVKVKKDYERFKESSLMSAHWMFALFPRDGSRSWARVRLWRISRRTPWSMPSKSLALAVTAASEQLFQVPLCSTWGVQVIHGDFWKHYSLFRQNRQNVCQWCQMLTVKFVKRVEVCRTFCKLLHLLALKTF